MAAKTLSKPAKQAAVQAYQELGFSIRDTAEILKLGKNTVNRYQKVELEEQWGQFKDTIKKVFITRNAELNTLAYQGIKGKVDKAEFRDLVGLYKITAELSQEDLPLIDAQGAKILVMPSTIMSKHGIPQDTRPSSSKQS